MSDQLGQEDVDALLEEVRRFAHGSLTKSLEVPVTTATLLDLEREAADLGLLGSDFGLWAQAHSRWGRLFSWRALAEMAKVSAGVAFHFHRRALGQRIVRSLSLPGEGAVALSLQGSYGLGRDALPRLLAGMQPTNSDIAFLRDWLAPSPPTTRLLHCGVDWDWVVTPLLVASGGLVWRAFARDAIEATRQEHAHGLDGATVWSWRPVGQGVGPEVEVGGETSRQLYAEALADDALGLVAVALGAVEKSISQAMEYAHARRQGGDQIVTHAAVRDLLGGAIASARASRASLESGALAKRNATGLAQILSLRAETQPRLLKAANDAMQVLGGSGYMRDTGMERAVRDANHLRLLAGTPIELRMFTATWEALA